MMTCRPPTSTARCIHGLQQEKRERQRASLALTLTSENPRGDNKVPARSEGHGDQSQAVRPSGGGYLWTLVSNTRDSSFMLHLQADASSPDSRRPRTFPQNATSPRTGARPPLCLLTYRLRRRSTPCAASVATIVSTPTLSGATTSIQTPPCFTLSLAFARRPTTWRNRRSACS